MPHRVVIEILIQRGLLTAEQGREILQLCYGSRSDLVDMIVGLGYASADDVLSAIAESLGIEFIRLSELTIPESIIELVPESVARENTILPLEDENGRLRVI